jgi:hypothetical protein
MLSGFPFRMVNELQGAYSAFSRLVGGMMQTPHPQAPDLPMAADPRLDLTPYLYRTLEALQKEMSYAGRYRPIDPTDEPSVSGTKQLVAAAPQAPVAPVAQAPVGTYYPQAVPQVAPQGTTSYQSVQSQSVPQSQGSTAPQGNPWESAFNKVVNLLGSPVQSPFQGAPSQVQAPAPIQYTQANWGTQAAPAQAPNLGAIGSSDLANKPDLIQQLFPNLLSQLVGGRSGSPGLESREPDGGGELRDRGASDSKPVRSNLESVVDSALAWGSEAQHQFARAADFMITEHQENLAYNEMLTNPDILSDYTLKFFGPEGPYPVYESEAELATPGYPTAAVRMQQTNVAGLPAPPQASARQAPQDFWGSFKQQMDQDPSQAWRVINQASPQAIANKLFVME